MRRFALLLLILKVATLQAQHPVTSPKDHFGHEIGADYVLPNYRQLTEYWQKLDTQSDRMIVNEIGRTTEGRTQLMAIITSPANHKRLEDYQDIARRLALADGLTEDQARALANEGKAVVWIDGGLHATEVLGAQQLMETVYQLVSRSDAETMRILDDVVILAVHANPDGHDLVADWYMRIPDPVKRSTTGVPRLYQKYAGHDNNRDSYLNALPETQNMSRIQFREWFPQIVYNHHQSGPSGSVLFAPPFRDPFNYNLDPLIPAQIDAVGAAMHSRFIAENKPGAVTRRATSYSNWWNGGIRTTTGFHNMIGLLTETIGNPTPIAIPFVARLQLPSTDVFMPIEPQKEWHFRQSIDYSVTANYAVLDYASRHREQLLYGIYRMGRNSIERGKRDTWTVGAWELERARKAITADSIAMAADSTRRDSTSLTPRQRYDRSIKYFELLRDPARRAARGYILPADQPDFGTATKFVNGLLMSGISVLQAQASFRINSISYPAGSYVVKTAQAFRPHVLDMFEPQQHPDDFQYPGGPPIAPYDNAGYTLAYQMGVRFDRVLDAFDGPFVRIEGVAKVPAGRVVTARKPAGYVFSHAMNDAFTATSRLLAAGYAVSWLREPFKIKQRTYPSGTLFVKSKQGIEHELGRIAAETGVSFDAVSTIKGAAFQLKQPRIALWEPYGGASTSGWIRYVFDQFAIPYDVIYPPAVDAGRLRALYDVIILPDRAIPRAADGDRDNEQANSALDTLEYVPAEWRARMGRYSKEKTAPRLKEFVEQGGTLITIGSATVIARDFGVAVDDALVTVDSAGKTRPLRRNEFYIPGSVLDVKLDTSQPLAAGMSEKTMVLFSQSPAFRLKPGSAPAGMRPIAWYEREPLRSGWAWGQSYLDGALAALEADVGEGKLIMFGPEITFRAQPHGTFKFLFNAIFYGSATPGRLP
jgi:hypothetical protein